MCPAYEDARRCPSLAYEVARIIVDRASRFLAPYVTGCSTTRIPRFSPFEGVRLSI